MKHVSSLITLLFAFYAMNVESHTKMMNVIINGSSRTNCLRPYYPGNLYHRTNMGPDWPISSSNFLEWGITSNNYTCGFLPFAGQAAASKCQVAAGSQIGVSYYHGAFGNEDPVLDRWIARSHKGPFMAFLAKSETGQGNVWFKIYQQGKIQESNNFNNVKWASPDTMLANDGVFYFTIPSDIAPGNYLLRTEIIALHDTSTHGAQPYVQCTELQITGSGNINPPGVSIPGNWGYNHPGLTYNIYNRFTTPYPFPGPEVYQPGSIVETTTGAQPPVTTGQTTPVTTGSTSTSTTSGGEPPIINVKISVRLPLTAEDIDLNIFIYEITQVLGIPANALADITIDLDRSSSTFTVVQFTVWNAPRLPNGRVDPIAVALRLKSMAAANDPALRTSMLLGLQVVDVESQEQNNSNDDSEPFIGSTLFIIIAACVGAAVIAIVVGAAVAITRRRKYTGWI